MSNPIHSVLSAAEHFVSPITNMFSRMFTMPGGMPNINIPNSQLIPAQQPAVTRPSSGGMQQSFLSGVAQGGLPGQAAASTTQAGKTLLGA